MLGIYVTHPEVLMDPAVPVPQWGLSDVGEERARRFAERGVIPRHAPVFASTERKAVELADILAARSGGEVSTIEALGENDRSATGYLAPESFEAMVERFFADPDHGPDGWESARAAQERVVGTVTAILERAGGPVVFCGHGGVGSLLKCHVAGRPIARSEDQRVLAWPGGGNCFVFELSPRRLFGDWQPMEDFTGLPVDVSSP